MPYRPRELVVRAREAAALLLGVLDRDEMVARFLDLYSAEHRRPGRADQPGHYREQLETIRREAVLAMVLRIEAALPTRLKVSVSVGGARRVRRRKRGGKKTIKRQTWELAIPLLDLFREEFFVALGQALDWSDQDAQEFWHDLELYEKLTRREPQHLSRRSARTVISGPFVDRVGLLLDPSLMEQARRVAGSFQLELNSVADRVLRRVFSRRRNN